MADVKLVRIESLPVTTEVNKEEDFLIVQQPDLTRRTSVKDLMAGDPTLSHVINFHDGGTLNGLMDFCYYEEEDLYLRWTGAYPHVVPSLSSPYSDGGITDGAWSVYTDPSLREELGSTIGASLVLTEDGRTVQDTMDEAIDAAFETARVLDGLSFERVTVVSDANYLEGYAGHIVMDENVTVHFPGVARGEGTLNGFVSKAVETETSNVYEAIMQGGTTGAIYTIRVSEEEHEAVCRQIGGKHTTPEQFLESATDMTEAIQMAFDYGDVVDLSGTNYTIVRTINIPDGRVLCMQGSNITAATGATPVFSFSGKSLGLTIIGGSGVVTGSASAFLYCEGASDTPVNADYVKQVRIYGVNVSSATFERAVLFDKAVRQVFIDNCMFYTRNGIESTGKCVEVMINKSIVYGATPDVDTFGVKLSSTGGTKFYNEGWHLTDCTVDNFANSIDLADVFVFTFKNGYVGCNATTAFAVTVRGVTTTTHCREINLDGVIGGKVRFLDRASGSLAVHTFITGEITNCKPGTCIAIGANLAGIDIRDIKITSSPSCILASVANNSGNIHFAGVSTDSSLTAGIIFNGANGGNCSISDFSYAGSGEALSLARAVRLSNVPVVGATAPIWSVRHGYQSTTTTVTTGNYISSTQFTAAKGSKLLFNINMSYTGAAGSNEQSIRINVPANVSLPNGAQWMTLILPAASGTVGLSLVCTVTGDFINNLFSVTNNTGNTLSILPGAHVSVSLCN